eukprot:gb/GECG01012645.1/.p1 GENE.gb/GECG01012645.1/~~gb/GECG01012645.1/.p1  ORF type:complete len:486 (+),score=64.59 gb/GECG01012645.1/:1-1458(+)
MLSENYTSVDGEATETDENQYQERTKSDDRSDAKYPGYQDGGSSSPDDDTDSTPLEKHQSEEEMGAKLQQFIQEYRSLKRKSQQEKNEDVGALRSLQSAQAKLDKLATELPQRLKECSHDIKSACEQMQKRSRGRGSSSYENSKENQRLYHLFFEKTFEKRESLLTDMLDSSPNYKTLYNISVSVMMWMMVNMMVDAYLKDGTVMDFSFLVWGFSGADDVVRVWLAMFVAAFLIVPFVQLINSFDIPLLVWGPVYLVYQLLFIAIPTAFVFQSSLPPPSAMILMCEQTRMCMKVHAYLREKMLYGSGKFDEYWQFIPDWASKQGVTLREHVRPPKVTIEDASTEIGRYIYFHFAPTLVYRDHYPQSGKQVHWIRGFKHFLNLFLVILFLFLLLKTFCIPEFRESATHPGDLGKFVKSIFRSMLPAMLILMLAFFGLLHSWFNAWSELLCFGDRRFYEDWYGILHTHRFNVRTEYRTMVNEFAGGT